MEKFHYIAFISCNQFYLISYYLIKNGKYPIEFSMFRRYDIDPMENKPKFRPDPGLKLMDQVRQVLHYHHYAYRTEQTYCDWIVRYIKYFGAKKHPQDMGKTEIDGFLSHLATDRKVSASTYESSRSLWAMPM